MVIRTFAVTPSTPANAVELQPLQGIDPSRQLSNAAHPSPQDSITIEPVAENNISAADKKHFEGLRVKSASTVLHSPEPPKENNLAQPTKVTPDVIMQKKAQQAAGVVLAHLKDSPNSPSSRELPPSLSMVDSDEAILWLALGAMLLLGVAAPICKCSMVVLQCCGATKVEPYQGPLEPYQSPL